MQTRIIVIQIVTKILIIVEIRKHRDRFAQNVLDTKYLTQNVSLKMSHKNFSHKISHKKCCTQNVAHKMSHTKCLTQNVSHKMSHSTARFSLTVNNRHAFR